MLKTVAAGVALAATAGAVQYPNIAGDWSAFVVQTMEIAQGSYSLPNGDICCTGNAVQCQVQVQSQGGATYFSVNNQAVATMNPDHTGIISLLNSTILMEVAVDANMNCQQYCPIDPSEAPLTPYSVVNFTDIGPSVVNNIKVEGWQVVDVIPGLNITMETQTIYVDQSNFNDAKLVFEYDILEPFGNPQGTSNTTYTGFKAAPQPAALFAVKGLSTCPQSNQCGQSSERQIHRRVASKLRFWKNFFAAKTEKNQQ